LGCTNSAKDIANLRKKTVAAAASNLFIAFLIYCELDHCRSFKEASYTYHSFFPPHPGVARISKKRFMNLKTGLSAYWWAAPLLIAVGAAALRLPGLP
jgi:hypothetical protein